MDSYGEEKLEESVKKTDSLVDILSMLRTNEANGTEEPDVLPGAQFDGQQTFIDRYGTKQKVTPVIVDFKRLLLSSLECDDDTAENSQLISGINNQDLLHAVVGLYDVCLGEMTPDVIYSTICEKWARTVLLLADEPEIVLKLQKRKKTETKKSDDEMRSELEDLRHVDGKEDKLDEDEVKPCLFTPVYSDSEIEQEESEEEDSEDDIDFSMGVHSFIRNAVIRRHSRHKCEDNISNQHVGIENRLIAAATFERSFCNPGEKVLHLTLLAVRKRFQHCGIGRYILSQLKEPGLVGPYDAIVVHADNSAIDFFSRYGFSDDLILNSRWSDLAEQFTNCTLMCYLPPYSGQSTLNVSMPELDLLALEKDIKKWRNRTVDAYRAEASCMMRLRHEIIQLKAVNQSQEELIHSLSLENKRLKASRTNIEKQLIHYKVQEAMNAVSEYQPSTEEDFTDSSVADLIEQLELVDRSLHQSLSRKSSGNTLNDHPTLSRTPSDSKTECLSTSGVTTSSRHASVNPPVESSAVHCQTESTHLSPTIPTFALPPPSPDVNCTQEEQIHDFLEQSILVKTDFEESNSDLECSDADAESISSSAGLVQCERDLAQVRTNFRQGMKLDGDMAGCVNIINVNKILTNKKYVEQFVACRKSLHDSSMVTQLYLCNSLQDDQVKRIIKEGFQEIDLHDGDYGCGLYFTLFPSKAVHYASPGHIIVAEVALGKTETVMKADDKRAGAMEGHDSLITPGRSKIQCTVPDACVESNAMLCQEYVIFNPLQAKPVYEIEFEALK